jgi:phosphoribosylformylglycinamidine (FGAM) synthase-like enzyme
LVPGSHILLIGAGASTMASASSSTVASTSTVAGAGASTRAGASPVASSSTVAGASTSTVTPPAEARAKGAPGDHADAAVSLAGSRWAVELRGHRGGRLAPLDLDLHRRLLALVRDLVNADLLDGIHDLSDGGLGVALAEMAVRSQVGFRVEGIADHIQLFGEGPSRLLVSVPAPALEEVRAAAATTGVGCAHLGTAGGDRLVCAGLLDLPLAAAVAAWRGALPNALQPEAVDEQSAGQI